MQNRNKLSKQKRYFLFTQTGTSLMELLVTLSIITLLLAAGIPAFSKFGQQNKLTQEADFFKDAILTTQNYSLAPEVANPSGISHYIFQLQDKNYFVYRGSCKESVSPRTEENTVKSLTLPQDISIEPNASLCFSIQNQGKMTYPNSSLTFTLTSSKITSKRIIFVNKTTGQVSIEKK